MGFTPPYKMSETYRTNIKAKSATTATTLAGQSITAEGVVASGRVDRYDPRS